MHLVYIAPLLAAALCAAPEAADKGKEKDGPTYVGPIICYSDTAEGTRMAEAAAEIISSRGHERYFSKSFMVIDTEVKPLTRYLILILNDEGEKEFSLDKGRIEGLSVVLLQKMKQNFRDNNVSVIVQLPDKSNVVEASLNERGVPVIKDLIAMTPTPTISPDASPSVSVPFPAANAPPALMTPSPAGSPAPPPASPDAAQP